MSRGARTPEELETLLEDAFVMRDGAALGGLFEDGAVLVARDESPEARGEDAIARAATEIWRREGTYLAQPRHVLQARDTALVIAEHGINVGRRGSDGVWRYAISLLSIYQARPEEKQ